MHSLFSLKPDPQRIYRLPVYFLLPFSLIFLWGDNLLLNAAGDSKSNYDDASTRCGMGLGIVIAPVFVIGSYLLLVAAASFVKECCKKNFDWRAGVLVLLGILSHPWVAGRIVDALNPHHFSSY